MRKLQRFTVRTLAVTGLVLTTGLLTAGARAGNAPAPFTPSQTKFVLPGGEVVIGQIISYEGEMYLVRLPRGMMLLRKDYPVAMKSLRSSGRVAHESMPKKPIL